MKKKPQPQNNTPPGYNQPYSDSTTNKSEGAQKKSTSPETTFQLLKMIIVSAFKNLPKTFVSMIFKGAISFAIVFFINAYVLAVKNEGVNLSIPKTSPWYPLVNIGANQASFTALCFLLFFILSTLYERVKAKGLKLFLLDLAGIPAWTAESINESGKKTLPVLIFSTGLMMLVSLWVQNKYFYITTAFGLFLAYSAKSNDLSIIFAKVFWSDIQKLFRTPKNRKAANIGVLSLFLLGLTIGSIVLIFIPKQPLLPSILGGAFMILGVLDAKRKISPQTAMLIFGFTILGTILADFSRVVFADDGGWQEGGSNMNSYIKSPGANAVIKSGVKPGLLATAGSLLGGLFSSGYNLVSNAASTTYEGAKYVGGKVVDGATYVGGKVVDGATYVGGKVVDGATYVGGKVVDGATYVGQTVIDTGKGIYTGVKEIYDNPKIITDTLVSIKNEIYETGVAIKDGVIYVSNEVYEAGKDIYNDPSILIDTIKGTAGDIKDGITTAITETAGAIKDIYNDPQILIDTITGTTETIKNITTSIGNAIYTTVTDPEKAWEFIKDSVGAKNFENSLDPNRNLIDRIGQVIIGTVKLGTTIATAGQVGTVVKTGAKGLLGLGDDVIAAGTKGGGKSVVTTIPNKLPVKTGTGYTSTGKLPDLTGVTGKSKIAIQNVADEMGLQIHTRPTTGKAKELLESGKAVAKPMDIKPKTLNKIDEIIGGPKNNEGVVGFFDPKRPPDSVMKKLTPEMRDAVEERLAKRAKEFSKYKDEIKGLEKQGKITRKDGIIYDAATNKPYTGDVDIFDITNFDGTPVPESVKQAAWKKLQGIEPANVKHGNLTSWNPSDPHFDPEAYIKMINDGKAGGAGVGTFNPLNNPTHNVMNGPKLVFQK